MFIISSTGGANVTGDGTTYTIPYSTAIKNIGSHFNTGTYTFTAPVTGLYLFNFTMMLTGFTASHTVLRATINTSNRVYEFCNMNPTALKNADNELGICGSHIVDMDVNDTAKIQIFVDRGTKVVDVIAAAPYNILSGALLS